MLRKKSDRFDMAAMRSRAPVTPSQKARHAARQALSWLVVIGLVYCFGVGVWTNLRWIAGWMSA